MLSNSQGWDQGPDLFQQMPWRNQFTPVFVMAIFALAKVVVEAWQLGATFLFWSHFFPVAGTLVRGLVRPRGTGDSLITLLAPAGNDNFASENFIISCWQCQSLSLQLISLLLYVGRDIHVGNAFLYSWQRQGQDWARCISLSVSTLFGNSSLCPRREQH